MAGLTGEALGMGVVVVTRSLGRGRLVGVPGLGANPVSAASGRLSSTVVGPPRLAPSRATRRSTDCSTSPPSSEAPTT